MEVSRHICSGRTIIVVQLPDRRIRGHPAEQWCFQRDVELALYNCNSGALYRLLQRCSLSSAPLQLKADSVTQGTCTRQEYDALVSLFSEQASFEAQGRVRGLTLIAKAHIPTLCLKLGRNASTRELMDCLQQPQPRLWRLEEEKEKNEEENEVDLLLDDEIEQEEEFDRPLHAELLYTAVQYEVTPEEQEATRKHYKLDRIPPSLEKQLAEYKDWRLQPLNFQRSGNAIVDVTAENDRSTVIRFLAYCKGEKRIDPGFGVFVNPDLAGIVQGWLEHARERGLMWSTMSNYVNSLCNICSYCWEVFDVDADALSMVPQNPDALIRLRAQCEGQSKLQQLYARKPANFLEWEDAQRARAKCQAEWEKSRSLPHDKRVALLKELLVLLFHTVMPPDR